MQLPRFWRRRPPLPEPIREEVAGGGTLEDLYWGRPGTGTEEDYFWRRLSDDWYQKDLIPSTYLEIHNQCYEAYNANPLAYHIIELGTSLVLGEGVAVVAPDRSLQALLDAFWTDPDNHMPLRCYSLCRELALYGEQFVRFFVNPFDGSVKIGQIDPSTIDEVETDPENVERELRYHQRQVSGLSSLVSGQVATRDEGPGTRDFENGRWFEAGSEVLHFAVNRVSNARRGRSDLATLLPWLRRYKDWLTDRVRINKYKGAFLYEITLQGADKRTVDRKKAEYAYPPEPGSVIVHNEAEQWSAVEPRIDADSVEADGRALKLMIAVGAGLPEHWLSEGGNVNRATAAEMGLPTFKRFSRRQEYLGFVLRSILDRVVAEARRAGRLPATVDASFEIRFPRIDEHDLPVLAAGFNSAVSALTAARAQGWLSQETAMKLLFRFAGAPELDVAAELERIARE